MGDYSGSMVISITGSPGTGKSTVCSKLSESGYSVTSVRKLAEQNNCIEEYDSAQDTYPIDVNALRVKSDLSEYDFIDGHLSHLLRTDAVVILRCKPESLKSRLEKRGYSEKKIRSNLEWEYLSGIASELSQDARPIIELDTTSSKISDLIDQILNFCDSVKSGKTDYIHAKIDWMNEPPNF